MAMKARMIDCGYSALYDAFCVMKNESVFNIFNSESGKVEEFKPVNAEHYSQAQCAIVIERVFSRLYRYLQFKSTTGERIKRHINVDMGYKYLDSESLAENGNSLYYYDGDEGKKYLRYLNRIGKYTDWDLESFGLAPDEIAVFKKFKSLLAEKTRSYIEGLEWNLCPKCGV